MTASLFDRATEAAQFIRTRLNGLAPRMAIVLGSGLGRVAEAVNSPIIIPYSQIPHFPQSTAIGHAGRFVAGTLAGEPIIVMQGRVHFYEGYSAEQVGFPMRVMGRLGVRSVILTNAAGGIDPAYRIGQLVLISDHINFQSSNPTIGPNDDQFGPRFFDMTEAYSKSLRALAREAALELGFTLDEGVYLALLGPSFETPAEIRAFRQWGATLVSMSTVPETIVARHMGIEVLGISCVTNLAASIGGAPLSHEEVFEAGRQVEHRLASLFTRLVPRIAACMKQES